MFLISIASPPVGLNIVKYPVPEIDVISNVNVVRVVDENDCEVKPPLQAVPTL